MRRRNTILGAIAGGVALCAVVAVTAGAIAAGPEAPHERHGMHGPRCEDIAAHEAGMLAFARVKLGITDAQKAIWSQFEDRIRTAGAPMIQQCAAMRAQPMPASLPDHMARMETEMGDHLQHLKAVHTAVEWLYPQLTDDQKHIADHAFEHMGPPHGPWGGHEGGPHDEMPRP